MRLNLSAAERNLLLEEQIETDSKKEYSVDEALDLLQAVYDVEAMYSDLPEEDQRTEKAKAFAHLADKLSAMIPES